MEPERKILRCAIYTRKSTEEGLEQEFNTLHAQREAGEAYIRSQQLGGWMALPDRYDDGGFSGASLERPGLKQLLSAIEAGKIDCVLVYKVDRLSRSLLDFAQLISLFDRHGVSFVSVTQEFNTTTSLGRLTLNILLSFAQFEREIISERTRDKLSAARRKGKWIGGIPVLGYDVAPEGGRLVINEQEATRVREIFAICEKASTLAGGLREVNARELNTKAWRSRGGNSYTGKLFSKTLLSRLLANVLYKGMISHKGTIYPGEHEAIVEAGIWEKVNRKLALNGASQVGKRHLRQQALLLGLTRCGQCGTELILTFTKRQGTRHSYYVCPQARRKQGCQQRPVAIEDLERPLAQRIEAVLGPQPSAVLIQQALERVIYASKTREVTVLLRGGTRFAYTLAIPNRGGVHRSNRPAATGRIPRITQLMALAIKIERLVMEGKVADQTSLATVGHISKPRMSQIMNLTNLAPEIQETLLFLPKTMAGEDVISERHLRPIVHVVDWDAQRKLFSARMSR